MRRRKRSNPKKWVPRLSPEESEKKVIKLYHAGAPIEEIARLAHKSPNTIEDIVNRYEKSMSPRSETKRSAALKLLRGGCNAEELAIRLDLAPHEVEQYKTELMTLRGIDDYDRIYSVIKDKIQDLCSFYDLCKMKGIGLDQISDLQTLVNNAEFNRSINDSLLKRQQELRQDLALDVTMIKKLEREIGSLKNNKKMIELELKVIEREVSKAEAMLQIFNSEKNLTKIKSIINSEMNRILKSEDNYELLQSALTASILTFKAYPRFRQLLEPPSFPDSYYPSAAEFMEVANETMNKMRGKILENAEENITEKILHQTD